MRKLPMKQSQQVVPMKNVRYNFEGQPKDRGQLTDPGINPSMILLNLNSETWLKWLRTSKLVTRARRSLQVKISTTDWMEMTISTTSPRNLSSFMVRVIQKHTSPYSSQNVPSSGENQALFLCFPRSLEGIATKWYSEHINPIELKKFDKVINLFIERFLFNVEALPTLSHLCGLKQKENEKARDFIHRWRSACNKMRDPISEEHALSLILSNFS